MVASVDSVSLDEYWLVRNKEYENLLKESNKPLMTNMFVACLSIQYILTAYEKNSFFILFHF